MDNFWPPLPPSSRFLVIRLTHKNHKVIDPLPWKPYSPGILGWSFILSLFKIVNFQFWISYFNLKVNQRRHHTCIKKFLLKSIFQIKRKFFLLLKAELMTSIKLWLAEGAEKEAARTLIRINFFSTKREKKEKTNFFPSKNSFFSFLLFLLECKIQQIKKTRNS